MELLKASSKDFNELIRFYRNVILNTKDMDTYAKWEYGKHPTDDMILGYIRTGAMYFCKKEGEIIAAVAVTPFQGEDYHDTLWSISLKDSEVSVVHILCVDPKLQKQGIAREIMEHIIELSRKQGKKAVRLDALACNTPAHRLYEGLGFERKSIRRWYAENVGWTDFFLFELPL